MFSALSKSSDASSKAETRAFITGSSCESSRTSSDPLLKDKSVSGAQGAELGMEDGVTASEDSSLTACERVVKGSLVEVIGGGAARKVLSAQDASVRVAPFWGAESLVETGTDSSLTMLLARVPSFSMNGLKWRNQGLSNSISTIKEALYGCGGSDRSLLTYTMVNGIGFNINLEERQ